LRLEDEDGYLTLSLFDLPGPRGDNGDGPEQAGGDHALARQPPFGRAAVTLEARAGTIAIELEYTPQYSKGDVQIHANKPMLLGWLQ